MILHTHFQTPLTDFSYILAPMQNQLSNNSFCCKLELKLLDCLEAYGVKKAKEKCAELLYDFAECSHGHIQKLRVEAIQKERMKQYRAGKLSKPFEDTPFLDSYYYYT